MDDAEALGIAVMRGAQHQRVVMLFARDVDLASAR